MGTNNNLENMIDIKVEHIDTNTAAMHIINTKCNTIKQEEEFIVKWCNAFQTEVFGRETNWGEHTYYLANGDRIITYMHLNNKVEP